MPRYHTNEHGNIPFTAEEEIAWDKQAAKSEVEKPMKEWLSSMNESDSSMIPRSLEDVLDMVGTTDLAEQTLDKYNSKKALRATKPKE